MPKVAAVRKLLIVHADNDIACFEPGLLRGAAFLHRTDQNTVAVLNAEEFAQLPPRVLGLGTEPLGINLDLKCVSRNLDPGGLNPGNHNAGLYRGNHNPWAFRHHLSAVAQLYTDLHRVAVAAETQRYGA